MNLPNRLTLLRVALIPAVILFLSIEQPASQALALGLFIIAALTDLLDGYLARRDQAVTNFGKFLDPVADKLLVLSTMIAFCGQGRIPAWVCIVILFREIAVDGLRLVAVEQGKVIAAGNLGKVKTGTQIAMLILVFLRNWPFGTFPMETILMLAAVVMTLWSGVDYFMKNREVLNLSAGGEKL